jgi:excisionase family DNA binding protein
MHGYAVADHLDMLIRPVLNRMMKSKMENRWLSVDEIGEYLGFKRDTVYKWISEKICRTTRLVAYGNSKKTKLMGGYVKEVLNRLETPTDHIGRMY